MENTHLMTEKSVIRKIFLVRGHRVMLDQDLAALYGVETKVLKQAVRRNIGRFPEDFMFEPTSEEWTNLRSQFVASSAEAPAGNWGGTRYMPFCFTEQGVAMLSSVLKSERAILVNIQIIRIFTKMREFIALNKDILVKLERLERQGVQHDDQIRMIFQALKQLLEKPPGTRNPVGFKRGNER